MANGDELPLSLEIPWRLASTTQLLTGGEPDETTISFFTFRPDARNCSEASRARASSS